MPKSPTSMGYEPSVSSQWPKQQRWPTVCSLDRVLSTHSWDICGAESRAFPVWIFLFKFRCDIKSTLVCALNFSQWQTLLLLLLLLSHFSRVRLCCDPKDGSPAGSLVPEILQAKTLEWVAISFSNAWKWKVKVKSLSRVRLLATPWTAAYQAPLSMGFSRQEYWSGVPLPSPNKP